jgi:hypothetical protein
MAMHLVSGRFVAAVAVLLSVAVHAASAQDHKTYRCKVADVVTWDDHDDGHLRQNGNPKEWARQSYDGIIVDTLTGAVTYPDGFRSTFIVLKPGDDQERDYVLAHEGPLGPSPLQGAMLNAINRSIRIRTWGGNMPRFMAVELGTSFVSGPCEVVR